MPPAASPPRPLPIRPRPMTGESPVSYARRLARANHMRPGYLRRYLRSPGEEAAIRLDWLAILAGRSQPALQRALAGPASDHQAGPGRQHMRQADKPRLFAAIRRDARDNGLSIRALADRHGVHRPQSARHWHHHGPRHGRRRSVAPGWTRSRTSSTRHCYPPRRLPQSRSTTS